jgi:hypothetical protein
MAVALDDFGAWLAQAGIAQERLTPEQLALLQAAFRFRQQQGCDYYSTRFLSHFLLHCNSGLKVAQIARLLGISRPNASRQQNLSSKAAIGQAHHRMAGRHAGKLLPRYAGPIAAFLLGHPASTRAQLLDFIEQTFAVRVSRVALHKFLKKYGLDGVSSRGQPAAPAAPCVDTATLPPVESPSPSGPVTTATAPVLTPIRPVAAGSVAAPAEVIELACALQPGRPAAPPFSSGGRNTPAPSC